MWLFLGLLCWFCWLVGLGFGLLLYGLLGLLLFWVRLRLSSVVRLCSILMVVLCRIFWFMKVKLLLWVSCWLGWMVCCWILNWLLLRGSIMKFWFVVVGWRLSGLIVRLLFFLMKFCLLLRIICNCRWWWMVRLVCFMFGWICCCNFWVSLLNRVIRFVCRLVVLMCRVVFCSSSVILLGRNCVINVCCWKRVWCRCCVCWFWNVRLYGWMVWLGRLLLGVLRWKFSLLKLICCGWKRLLFIVSRLKLNCVIWVIVSWSWLSVGVGWLNRFCGWRFVCWYWGLCRNCRLLFCVWLFVLLILLFILYCRIVCWWLLCVFCWLILMKFSWVRRLCCVFWFFYCVWCLRLMVCLVVCCLICWLIRWFMLVIIGLRWWFCLNSWLSWVIWCWCWGCWLRFIFRLVNVVCLFIWLSCLVIILFVFFVRIELSKGLF